jgi:hypothetical protein
MKKAVGPTSSPNVVIGDPVAGNAWIKVYAYLPLKACGMTEQEAFYKTIFLYSFFLFLNPVNPVNPVKNYLYCCNNCALLFTPLST